MADILSLYIPWVTGLATTSQRMLSHVSIRQIQIDLVGCLSVTQLLLLVDEVPILYHGSCVLRKIWLSLKLSDKMSPHTNSNSFSCILNLSNHNELNSHTTKPQSGSNLILEYNHLKLRF